MPKPTVEIDADDLWDKTAEKLAGMNVDADTLTRFFNSARRGLGGRVRDFLALAYTADMICEGGKPKHLSKTVDILRRLQDTSDTQMVIAGVMALDEIRDVSPLEFGLRMGEVHRKINETLRGDEDRKLPHVKDIK